MLVRVHVGEIKINVWNLAIYKALQMLYERVSYSTVRKFLEANEDKRKKALDRSPQDLVFLSIDLMFFLFL